MVYGSVCSGIEAASAAWHPLGWRPAFFAEIEPFPSAVLAHHYPDVPNLGDITRFKEWPDADIDVLVGGTPCQPFSIAGLRKGLADPRGGLALTFLEIAQRYRPGWILWENVPGVLSQDGGRAFGSFLGGLAELGYGWAYRVMDAQYFGLAQRRARVFVVGSARGWASAAAVLFEPASLSGHPAPSRAAREDIAQPISASSPSGSGYRNDADTADNLIANCLNAKGGSGRIDAESETFVTHSLRAEGFDASEDGTGRGTPIIAAPLSAGNNADSNAAGRRREDDINLIAFDTTQITSKANRCNPQPGDPSHPLASGAHAPAIAFHARQDPDSGSVTHPLDTDGSSIAVAVNLRGRDGGAMPETSEVASLRSASGGSSRSFVQQTAVRRLTPTEAERLQGFPDGYTAIPFRGKPAKDAPRYKALGNSMAVPVIRWFGERIELVESVISEMEAA